MSKINKYNYINYKVYSVIKTGEKYGFRIKLDYEDGSDCIIQKGAFDTITEASEERDNTVIQLYTRTYNFSDDITVKEFLSEWLEYRMVDFTYNTYYSYKRNIINHINPIIGNKKFKDINRRDISDLYEIISIKSISAARLTRVIMVTAFNHGINNNIVRANPAQEILINSNKKNIGYRTRAINTKKTLTEEQLKTLIKASKNTSIYLHVIFASLMGLRRGEINGLKYSDVNFSKRTLKVQRQLGNIIDPKTEGIKSGQFCKQEIPVKTKSSNRTLNIPDLVFEAILDEKAKYDKNRRRRINDKTTPFKDLNFICCSTYGNPRGKSFHIKKFKLLLAENNLPDIRFHDLRATYTTILINNQFSPKAVSKLLGHSNEIITLDIYTDKENVINDLTEPLENFIKNLKRDDDYKEKINISLNNVYDKMNKFLV